MVVGKICLLDHDLRTRSSYLSWGRSSKALDGMPTQAGKGSRGSPRQGWLTFWLLFFGEKILPREAVSTISQGKKKLFRRWISEEIEPVLFLRIASRRSSIACEAMHLYARAWKIRSDWFISKSEMESIRKKAKHKKPSSDQLENPTKIVPLNTKMCLATR